MLKSWSRQAPTVFVGLLLIGALFAGQSAIAQSSGGTPANKFAASGSTREVFGPGTDEVILSEQVKMPTNHELALSLSLECSIITALKVEDEGGTKGVGQDGAEGKIDVWIEIDGKPVGVTSDQTGRATDDGQVTFCNRERQVRLTDTEQQGTGDPMDGIDTFEEYDKSKTANAFNWIALNVGNGGYFDDPANGNNILDVVVYATLENTPTSGVDDPATPEDESRCELGDKACSEAIIGNRTLIVEPTKASVVEFVQEDGPGPN